MTPHRRSEVIERLVRLHDADVGPSRLEASFERLVHAAYRHCRETGEPVEYPQFPHCDAAVLHAPSECTYCDGHPEWQTLREVWGINFTGHYDTAKLPCPAEQKRGLGRVGRNGQWAGNAPTNGRLPDADEVADAIAGLRRIQDDLL